MADNHSGIMRETLLQEGVSCARATLHAITTADLFRVVPDASTAEKELFDHGTWLLAMLSDQLGSIQRRVDALSGFTDATSAEASA